MTDEPSASTGATPSQEGAATPAQVDYNALLDQIPDDVLSKHRRFNGIVGSRAQTLAQRLAEQERQRIAGEEFERAKREKEAELERLAEENPFEFSQRYLKDKAKEKVQLELNDLRSRAQTQLFEKIASSYSALPEWQNLSPDEFAKVQQQVAGKNDDELVAAFNVAALDVLAERRATSRAERAVQERLAAERAAWEQDYHARRLRGEVSPDMSAPVSANGINDAQAIKNMTPAEFDAFYNARFRT